MLPLIVAASSSPVLVKKPVIAKPQDKEFFHLRRAYGVGFGTGELLVRVNRFRKGPIELVDCFLPESLDMQDCTKPFESYAIPRASLDPDRQFDYEVVEVTACKARRPRAQRISPRPHFQWTSFEWENFPIHVNAEQQSAIAAFTGVVLKLGNRHSRKSAGVLVHSDGGFQRTAIEDSFKLVLPSDS